MNYKQISIGFYPEDYDKLEVVSQRLGKSKGACVRELIHLYFLNVDKLTSLKEEDYDY